MNVYEIVFKLESLGQKKGTTITFSRNLTPDLPLLGKEIASKVDYFMRFASNKTCINVQNFTQHLAK